MNNLYYIFTFFAYGIESNLSTMYFLLQKNKKSPFFSEKKLSFLNEDGSL